MSNTTPLPTISKSDHLLLNSGDNEKSKRDKDSDTPGFKMPNSTSLLEQPVNQFPNPL